MGSQTGLSFIGGSAISPREITWKNGGLGISFAGRSEFANAYDGCIEVE